MTTWILSEVKFPQWSISITLRGGTRRAPIDLSYNNDLLDAYKGLQVAILRRASVVVLFYVVSLSHDQRYGNCVHFSYPAGISLYWIQRALCEASLRRAQRPLAASLIYVAAGERIKGLHSITLTNKLSQIIFTDFFFDKDFITSYK